MDMDNNKASVTVGEHECLFNVVRTILYLLRWANLPFSGTLHHFFSQPPTPCVCFSSSPQAEMCPWHKKKRMNAGPEEIHFSVYYLSDSQPL